MQGEELIKKRVKIQERVEDNKGQGSGESRRVQRRRVVFEQGNKYSGDSVRSEEKGGR